MKSSSQGPAHQNTPAAAAARSTTAATAARRIGVPRPARVAAPREEGERVGVVPLVRAVVLRERRQVAVPATVEHDGREALRAQRVREIVDEALRDGAVAALQ